MTPTTQLLDGLIEGCQIISPDFRYLYSNEAAARHGNTKPAAITGRKVAEVYPGIEATPAFEDLARCMADGVRVRREDQYPTSDGVHWVEVRMQRIPEGVFILSLDVTAAKRAAEQDERYRRIIETTSEGVVSVDRATRITFANPRFCELLGYRLDELMGKSTLDLMDDEARAIEEEKVKRRWAGVAEVHEHCFRHKSGRAVWVRINSVPLARADGTIDGAMDLMTDITEAREAEVALRATEAQLRQMRQLEAIGSLAGGIAHEFNNLLSVIVGQVDLALEELGPAHALRSMLEEASTAAQRGAVLTRQMLAFSRQQTSRPVLIDVGATVQRMAPLLERLVSDDVRLVLNAEEALDGVFADPEQLEQVVVNLVVNACDAMVARGGTLTIATTGFHLDRADALVHPGVAPGDYVVLTVRDTGCGMDAATQARVFDPFFTTKDVGQGPGLGLSTVYGVVKQAGGHVALESAIGKGTTFRIYLPRAELKTKAPVADAAR